jgi:putative redox protein
LENINVTVTFNREKESKDSLKAKVELLGPLTAEMKSRLIEIAAKCPMHKTLSAGLEIRIA